MWRKLFAMLSTSALLVLTGCGRESISPSANLDTNSKPEVASSKPRVKKAETSSQSAVKKKAPKSIKKPPSFGFPKASCGDEASEESDTWWRVYIDSGDLDEIRRRYCKDAFKTVRKDTDAATIQVASFTSLERAKVFAKEVGGEVSQLVPETEDPIETPPSEKSFEPEAKKLTMESSSDQKSQPDAEKPTEKASGNPKPDTKESTGTPSSLGFPKNSCGDPIAADSSSDRWHVYIDGGDVDEVRRRYCRDAFKTVREYTDAPTIQVASFASRERAEIFAEEVGGTVESKRVYTFSFPKSSCGSPASERHRARWHVYIDDGDLDEIRRRYCQDAFRTIRKDTYADKVTIQVASFTWPLDAEAFAKEVGGEVSRPIYQGSSRLASPRSIAEITCPVGGELVSKRSLDAVDCLYSAKVLSKHVYFVDFREDVPPDIYSDAYLRESTENEGFSISANGAIERVRCVGRAGLETPVKNGVPLICAGQSAGGAGISKAMEAFFNTDPKIVCVFEPQRGILWKCRAT